MIKLKPKPLGKKNLKEKPKNFERKKKKSNPQKHLKKRIIFKNKLSFKKKNSILQLLDLILIAIFL